MPNRFDDIVNEKKQTGGSNTAEAAQAATGEDEGDTTRLNVRVPTALYNAYRDKVKGEGRTMTWVILQHMRAYIDESV